MRTLEGIGTEEADWQKKFFLLWRFWSERAAREWSPLLAYLVADTRIPDHTIWHHNAITAAFETAGNQAAFLLFQIGPVQEFIAQARRMIDLWSGSFLLSFLISQALAVIALEIGPDCIIYPSLRGAPLLDWRWKESRLFPEDILTLGKGRLHYDELLTPSLPNRFLALVPGERGQELARKAEEAVRSLWQKIHKTVYQQLCQKLEEVSGMTEALDQTWEEPLKRFPVVDWILYPWPGEEEAKEKAARSEDPIPLLQNGWSANPLYHMYAWREMIPANHRPSWQTNPIPARAWALHVAVARWKLAAHKAGRGFVPWPKGNTPAPPKDHLNGRDEVLGGSRPELFWNALRKAFPKDFPHRQLYGSLSVVKRLWPEAYLNQKLGWKKWKPQFLPPEEVLAAAIDREPEDTERYYAILRMDGDDIGQWISGTKLPPLKDVLAEKAWEYFRTHWKPGQVGGLCAEKVRRPLAPSTHTALSEALSNFALYAARQVVESESFGGLLLYAGGDDVLALLPANQALPCALALFFAFRGEEPPEQLAKVANLDPLFKFPSPGGFFVCKKDAGPDEALRPNWPLLAPGPRATASIGIAVGHVHAPMQELLEASAEAVAEAKRVVKKAAFCLRVLKRSGEATGFAAQFCSQVPVVWQELEQAQLPGRFAHRYLQLVQPLLLSPGPAGDMGWEASWTQELKHSVEAELAHVLVRQGGRKPVEAKEQAKGWIEKLVGQNHDQPVLSRRYYVHFWSTWAFLERISQSAAAKEKK